MPAIEFNHDGRQLIVEVAIFHPDAGQSYLNLRARALIDTGATLSGVSRSIIAELDLPRRGKIALESVRGSIVARIFQYRLGFFRTAAELPLVLEQDFIGFEISPGSGVDVLIGMDVLSRCDLGIKRSGACRLEFDLG